MSVSLEFESEASFRSIDCKNMVRRNNMAEVLVCLAIRLLLQDRISAVQGLCESRRPPVTLCTDRRTHASRRGLWEGGVALRGCALLLSFPFFPPSRPSSPPVLRPSPPLTYRLQENYLCGSLMLKQRGCCPWG